MKLIDIYAKKYQIFERHEIAIEASPARIYKEIQNIKFTDSAIIRFLFRLRGMNHSNGTLKDFAKQNKFTLLQERQNDEILLAFIVKAGRIEPIEDKEAFIHDEEDVTFKGYWNFNIEKTENTAKQKLQTETRVYCLSFLALALFCIYWFFIYPFSAWIRRIILRMIKNAAERKVA